jgi:ketosteroid isomerase-like protein
MSCDNVELVRALYAGPSLVEGPAHPDVEFDAPAVYPDQPVVRGVEAIARFRDAAWDSITFEPEQFFDVDHERVLAFVRARATGSASGATAETRGAHEFTIRDGLVTRVKIYPDRGEALVACGVTLDA